MEFAEQFGASVDIETATTDVGYFLVRRCSSVEHERFRAAVATVVGGAESIQLDAPNGFVVVVTQYGTAEALRTHPMVDHVGGVTFDPDQIPTPEVSVRNGTDDA